VTRILNPGKSWNDFHPGETAETTFATYVSQAGAGQEVIAVSQVEQLAQSKCVRSTQGKLWCGTCHSVHGEVTDRKAQIRAICTGCHSSLSAAAHPQPVSECTSCHMPRTKTTDISHAALTDHRILRRPGASMPESAAAADAVSAWRQPPAMYRERDLALAQIVVGFSKQLPLLTQTGFRLLQSLPSDSINRDPAALSDLEGLYAQQQDPTKAIQIGLQIVALQPQSAKAALNLGFVYKQAGIPGKAEQELNRAIQLDPGLKQAYIELAKLYADEHEMQDAATTLDRYLKWQPQDIMFRLQRARMN
jgi:predicted CXXCH cytochrome family protein